MFGRNFWKQKGKLQKEKQKSQLEKRHGGVKAHVCFGDASSSERLQHSVYGDGGYGGWQEIN